MRYFVCDFYDYKDEALERVVFEVSNEEELRKRILSFNTLLNFPRVEYREIQFISNVKKFGLLH